MSKSFIPSPNIPLFDVTAGSTLRGINITQADVDAGRATLDMLSDEDRRGVFTLPMVEYWNVKDAPQFIKPSGGDYMAHEAHRFAEFLRKGSPEDVELLYAPFEKVHLFTQPMVELRRNRSQFLSLKMVKSMLGNVKQNLIDSTRLVESISTTGTRAIAKSLSTVARLLSEVRYIMYEGYMKVDFSYKDGTDTLPAQIRRGEFNAYFLEMSETKDASSQIHGIIKMFTRNHESISDRVDESYFDNSRRDEILNDYLAACLNISLHGCAVVYHSGDITDVSRNLWGK